MPTKCQATGNFFRIHRRVQENEVSVEISADERRRSIEVAHRHDDASVGLDLLLLTLFRVQRVYG